MQPNPIKSLLRSRKFLLAMLDALVSSTALVLTWFLSPDKVGSVLALIGIWQPVLIACIVSIAAEDVANAKVGAELYKADKSLAEAKIYQDMPAVSESKPVEIKVECDEAIK